MAKVHIPTVSDCQLVITHIRKLEEAGKTLEEAARITRRMFPKLTDKVLDEIGSHPSSDRELFALQKLT